MGHLEREYRSSYAEAARRDGRADANIKGRAQADAAKWFRARGIRAPKQKARRGARVSAPDLAVAAAIYVLELRAGSKHPNQTIARLEKVSISVATKRILRSRRLGILESDDDRSQGKMGGRLTTYGAKMLQDSARGRELAHELGI
jgi:hypothetical protein